MQASEYVKLEWLETDGIGGFACGTVAGIRTRRYHGLLIAATSPPTGRMVLVNGLEVWLETRSGRYALSAQHYAPDVIYPNGHERIAQFQLEPWPTWEYRLENGVVLRQEILVVQSSGETLIRWARVATEPDSRLIVRPLLSGREYHGLHRENSAFDFTPQIVGESVRWRPYFAVPAIEVVSNGTYTHDPIWYRNFNYSEESGRGLDDIEDLGSPGIFSFPLARNEAILSLRCDALSALASTEGPVTRVASVAIASETFRRARFQTPIHRAADQYIVRRGTGETIIAGYPWFTDWGRDTFIALRGLCIASGRLDIAGAILLAWADMLSRGMLPNRFPEVGAEPEYTSVDASLWFVVAVHDFMNATAQSTKISPMIEDKLRSAVITILEEYTNGTRFKIQMDEDGLLAAGQAGVQLTWMDAKVGEWVVTPRVGKPVEVQALWLNALKIGSQISSAWERPLVLGLRSFGERFWNENNGYLFDNVDVDHLAGITDPSFRPNQIFAIGGLPFAVLSGERAVRVVSEVEKRLLTPMGLRSLAPGERDYVGHYLGNARVRDAAYHQGTVWPWLLGPFVEAWLRVHEFSPEARRKAQQVFLSPLHRHLSCAGLGHVSELADADAPHVPRGCPFQAWSLGELCRVQRLLDDNVPRPISGDVTLADQSALAFEARA